MIISYLLDILGNIAFITAPSLGFIPQLLRKNITFAPILSTILILANVFKILYFKVTVFIPEIFFQSVFLIVFHFILLAMSKPEKLSILEEKIIVNKYTEKSYKRFGLFSLIFTLVSTIVFSFAILGFVFTDMIFYLACPIFIILECSVGLVQLAIIETEAKFSLNKPKEFPRELFLLWALGDLLKLAWMVKIDGELLMCVSVAIQIILDMAVVFRKANFQK